ncbi:hypothetical protein SLNSH_23550 [Alsobacter soli]|uniref:Crp/Fnr family transcriptional regulator n=1 Tax=Alsobacter soli TaxID=2109933 RepID=A0A2T1HLL8_9HYPH|nr:Crp/Fnr family transcriptional regulator [Alsobacter soli]PSC02528.1 hypothetical protein SLNSH_23550 [Alsobacter soli]
MLGDPIFHHLVEPGRATQARARRWSPKNVIIGQMGPELQRVLCDAAEPVRLRSRQMLEDVAMECRHVYFIETGRVSLMARSGPGKTVDIGVLDRRDFVGLSLAFGETRSSLRVVVQEPGEALRVSAETFTKLLDAIPDLRRKLLVYMHRVYARNAQIALCNVHHPLAQRVARWLAWVADRDEQVQEIRLTHDQLARNLGVRRATISEALGQLEAQGLLQRRRGAIVVHTDQIAREACCCLRMLRRTEEPEPEVGRRLSPLLCS